MALFSALYLSIAWVIACKQRAKPIKEAISKGWIGLGNGLFPK